MRNFPHDPRYQILIKLLREQRLKSNLYQSELAIKLDRPQSYISKYENGECRLDFVDVYIICQALGLSATDFTKIYDRKVRLLRAA